MINFTTFQLKILKFYLLPLIILSLTLSLFLNFHFMKFFRNGIEFNTTSKEIKEIQRKNIELNGQELKRWTTLTDSQKDYFLENEKDKLEDKEKFKIKYKTERIIDTITDENINDNYNFIIFVKTMFKGFFFSIFSIILIFLIPAIIIYKFYKEYYLTKLKPFEKFINLPFFLNSLSSSLNNENKKILVDEFIKYDEKNNSYLYKTNSISQINIYQNNIKDIENYLNLQNLKISQKDLTIKIEEKRIKKFVEFNENNYLMNKLFLGESENDKKIYLDLNDLKHTIIVGQAGSGKSVFLQNLLVSIFKNIDFYEKIYLVDFKIVEMSRYENINSKIEVISEIDYFTQVIKEIHNRMVERYKEMKTKNLVNYDGKGFLVFIDEFRTLENNTLDKEQKKEMNKYLVDLIQKSRAAKIYLIFRGQKRDTTNINSNIISNIMNKIILKTSNNDNIIKVAGNREELERNGMSLNEIKNFNKGRLFYRDEMNGDKFLIQSPFFNIEDKKQRDFMFSFIEEEKNDSSLNEQKHTLNEQKEETEKIIRETIENDFKPLENDFNDILNNLKNEYQEKWTSLGLIEDLQEQKTKKSKLMNFKKVLNMVEKSPNMELIQELEKKFKEI